MKLEEIKEKTPSLPNLNLAGSATDLIEARERANRTKNVDELIRAEITYPDLGKPTTSQVYLIGYGKSESEIPENAQDMIFFLRTWESNSDDRHVDFKMVSELVEFYKLIRSSS